MQNQPAPLSFIATSLVTQYRRGIGIFAESFDVALGENFHHPAMEVIHRVILDRAKTAVVFFACFVEVTAQPFANVFVLTPQLDVLGAQKFDVLHRHFGYAVGAAMQILNFRWKAGQIERRLGARGWLWNTAVASNFRFGDRRPAIRRGRRLEGLGANRINGRFGLERQFVRFANNSADRWSRWCSAQRWRVAVPDALSAWLARGSGGFNAIATKFERTERLAERDAEPPGRAASQAARWSVCPTSTQPRDPIVPAGARSPCAGAEPDCRARPGK